MGSIVYLLEDKNAPSWLLKPFKKFPGKNGYGNLFFYPIAWLLSVFGQIGRMTVWAVKAESK